jgi:hypothetical protein
MKSRTAVFASVTTAVAAVAVAVTLAFTTHATAAPTAAPDPLVGTWSVQAKGAPYAPHLFDFGADNTMLSTNPTNVQQRANKPHDGTNDSIGMGTWHASGGNTYTGTFIELNADADDHQPAPTLTVTFTIALRGNAFTGSWTIPGNPPVTGGLTGTRIQPSGAPPSATS